MNLKDLIKSAVAENHDELEAMHAAQADEFHSGGHHHEDDDSELLAADDEFRVFVDAADMVHLHDGEGTIRVSMPYHVWFQLADETMHAHHVHMSRRHEGN